VRRVEYEMIGGDGNRKRDDDGGAEGVGFGGCRISVQKGGEIRGEVNHGNRGWGLRDCSEGIQGSRSP
jgi:hypothetical protein